MTELAPPEPLSVCSYAEWEEHRHAPSLSSFKFVFIPSLVSCLMAEREKLQRDLTHAEVVGLRDRAGGLIVPVDETDLAAERGYADLAPENIWAEWCAFCRGVS
jgi:hypothetical protein